MNQFKQILKDQIVGDDGFVDVYNLNVENWPETNVGEEGEEEEWEDVDLENHSLVKLTDDEFVLSAGGDWQNPVTMTIKLVDGKLKVTNVIHDEFQDGMDEEEFLKILNQ